MVLRTDHLQYEKKKHNRDWLFNSIRISDIKPVSNIYIANQILPTKIEKEKLTRRFRITHADPTRICNGNYTKCRQF